MRKELTSISKISTSEFCFVLGLWYKGGNHGSLCTVLEMRGNCQSHMIDTNIATTRPVFETVCRLSDQLMPMVRGKMFIFILLTMFCP